LNWAPFREARPCNGAARGAGDCASGGESAKEVWRRLRWDPRGNGRRGGQQGWLGGGNHSLGRTKWGGGASRRTASRVPARAEPGGRRRVMAQGTQGKGGQSGTASNTRARGRAEATGNGSNGGKGTGGACNAWSGAGWSATARKGLVTGRSDTKKKKKKKAEPRRSRGGAARAAPGTRGAARGSGGVPGANGGGQESKRTGAVAAVPTQRGEPKGHRDGSDWPGGGGPLRPGGARQGRARAARRQKEDRRDAQRGERGSGACGEQRGGGGSADRQERELGRSWQGRRVGEQNEIKGEGRSAVEGEGRVEQ